MSREDRMVNCKDVGGRGPAKFESIILARYMMYI
jgi:hypothetical protein